LDEEDHALLDCFMVWRGGGMGSGPLPFSGGYAEQPSAVMVALGYMADCWARLEPKRRGD
jgi:hypothetical protein